MSDTQYQVWCHDTTQCLMLISPNNTWPGTSLLTRWIISNIVPDVWKQEWLQLTYVRIVNLSRITYLTSNQSWSFRESLMDLLSIVALGLSSKYPEYSTKLMLRFKFWRYGEYRVILSLLSFCSPFLFRVVVYPIYPTPPLGQDMTQGQFLSRV